eukprot:9930654-Alexandrium_andersonii.AAC.1
MSTSACETFCGTSTTSLKENTPSGPEGFMSPATSPMTLWTSRKRSTTWERKPLSWERMPPKPF